MGERGGERERGVGERGGGRERGVGERGGWERAIYCFSRQPREISSTHKACDHYEASHGYNFDSSHPNRYLSEAEHNTCSKNCYGSQDMSSSCRPPSTNCGRQSHSRRSDGYDKKRESSRAERRNDFRPAFLSFHSMHEFSNNSNSCWKSTKEVLAVEVFVIITKSLL